VAEFGRVGDCQQASAFKFVQFVLGRLYPRRPAVAAVLTQNFYESLAEAKALAATLDLTDERIERLNAFTNR